MIAGTEGYERFIPIFIENSKALNFYKICKDFIAFLPSKPANILDAGSGAGQNAAALALLGYTVTAVEPMSEFLDFSRNYYEKISVKWLSGSFPDLSCIDPDSELFDFVLIDGVWHHLDDAEREQSIFRLSKIIKDSGRCAISLRNGPAGMGTRVYPTDAEHTIESFKKYGFECIFSLHNQPSFLAYKEDVNWSRLVLQKTGIANS